MGQSSRTADEDARIRREIAELEARRNKKEKAKAKAKAKEKKKAKKSGGKNKAP